METPESRERLKNQLRAYLRTLMPHPYFHGKALTYVRKEIITLLDACEKENRYDPDRIKDLSMSLEATARNLIYTNKGDDGDVTNKRHFYERAGFDLYAMSLGHPAPAEYGSYYEVRRSMGLEAQIVA